MEDADILSGKRRISLQRETVRPAKARFLSTRNPTIAIIRILLSKSIDLPFKKQTIAIRIITITKNIIITTTTTTTTTTILIVPQIGKKLEVFGGAKIVSPDSLHWIDSSYLNHSLYLTNREVRVIRIIMMIIIIMTLLSVAINAMLPIGISASTTTTLPTTILTKEEFITLI